AINKAVNQAKKNLIIIPIIKNTIPHRMYIKEKSAKILLKPAPMGTGIKAGGAVRAVLEIAGVPNIVAKILGCNNKVNNVKALLSGLNSFVVNDRVKVEKRKQDKKNNAEQNGKQMEKSQTGKTIKKEEKKEVK
ncbi:hypothetical protein A2300_04615, partial [Candidatus Falkowbacteria bacterium RIFOXYB2_FULL_35_7]